MDSSIKLLTHKDSNLDWRYQKPKCYRYTMGQYFRLNLIRLSRRKFKTKFLFGKRVFLIFFTCL